MRKYALNIHPESKLTKQQVKSLAKKMTDEGESGSIILDTLNKKGAKIDSCGSPREFRQHDITPVNRAIGVYRRQTKKRKVTKMPAKKSELTKVALIQHIVTSNLEESIQEIMINLVADHV